MRPSDLTVISMQCILGQSDRLKRKVRLLRLVHVQMAILDGAPVYRPRRPLE